MLLPSDPPTPTAPSANLIDTAPLIDPEQREKDFHRVFSWHDKEIALTLASELYYRELRVHGNAPALGSYDTLADFAPEAARVIYCAHLTPESIRALRITPPHIQLAAFDAWVEKNIGLHELNEAVTTAREMNECIARARFHTATGGTVEGPGN
jgi:hypothetical protein